jgi:uncharacterized membrane protein YedE/YeeE
MLHELLLGLAGGVLIGASAGLFMLCTGRIAGISGIAAELTGRWPPRWPQNVAFLAGLPGGLLLWRAVSGLQVPVHLPGSGLLLIAAGLLVGIGTRLANGCTSGHGVCGMARLSPRSIAATAIFFLVAVLVVAARRVLA